MRVGRKPDVAQSGGLPLPDFFWVQARTMPFMTPLRSLFLFLAWIGTTPCHADGLLAVSNPAKNGDATLGFAKADIFQANDNVALREYAGQWQGAYQSAPGINLGILFARAEVGVQWKGHRLFALQRGEALVQANRDTADLVHQYQTGSGYDAGRSYALDYSMRGFEADGVGISKAWDFAAGERWRMRSGVGVSYLRGKRLKMESITGQIVTLSAKDLTASATSDASNTSLNTSNLSDFNAPFGQQAQFSGDGYSLDGGMVLQDTQSGLRIELGLADVAGQLYWKNVPSNLTNYNTASKYYDANGYVQFDPTATRTSAYRNLTQTLPLKVHFAVAYPWGAWEVEGSTSHTQGIWFPQLTARYKVTINWTLCADYDLRFNSLGFGMEHRWFQWSIRTDNSELNVAKAYGLSAQIRIPL